jgi:hypothetical protein
MAADTSLYISVAKLEQQNLDIITRLDNLQQSQKDTQTYIQQMVVQNDDKYASKRTETTVDASIWIIVSTVILVILARLFKNKNEL